MIDLKYKEVQAFLTGLDQGLKGHGLGFDNTKHSFYKLYETKAFNKGYILGCNREVFDTNRELNEISYSYLTKRLLKWCIKKQMINPIDFYVYQNPEYFTFSIEML